MGGLSAEVGEEEWTSTVVADRSLHNDSGVVGMQSILFIT